VVVSGGGMMNKKGELICAFGLLIGTIVSILGMAASPRRTLLFCY